MRIDVTQKHIRSGIRDNCFHCPVARAIFDAIPNSFAGVNDSLIVVWIASTRHEIPTTPEVDDFIRDFDRGWKVAPFSFELPIELEVQG